jgi:hypothetical protein
MELKQKFDNARMLKRHVAVLSALATVFCSSVCYLWYYPHTSFIFCFHSALSSTNCNRCCHNATTPVTVGLSNMLWFLGYMLRCVSYHNMLRRVSYHNTLRCVSYHNTLRCVSYHNMLHC